MTLFGVPGKGLDFYHIGLAVPDVRAAMEQYSATFGFTWARIHERTFEVRVDGERRRAEIAVTYSMQGPPYLELVEERRGSIWGADGLSLTHVGFWAEDLIATTPARTGVRSGTATTRLRAACGSSWSTRPSKRSWPTGSPTRSGNSQKRSSATLPAVP